MENKTMRGSAKGSTNGGNIGRRTNPKAGRKKGTPNKKTAAMRERINMFTDCTYDDAISLWHQIKVSDPVKALDSWITLVEFNTPRLSRTELSGPDGGAIIVMGVVKRGEEPLEIDVGGQIIDADPS